MRPELEDIVKQLVNYSQGKRPHSDAVISSTYFTEKIEEEEEEKEAEEEEVNEEQKEEVEGEEKVEEDVEQEEGELEKEGDEETKEEVKEESKDTEEEAPVEDDDGRWRLKSRGLNSIQVWEWMWRHCFMLGRVVSILWEYTHAREKDAVKPLMYGVETTHYVASIIEVG